MVRKKNVLIDAFVGVVLLDNRDRIFLIKENDKNKIGKDRWNLPGGSIDGNEGLIEAAKREVKEETGFSSEIKSLLGCYKCRRGNNSWIYVVLEARIIKKVNGKTDPEIYMGKWFTRNEFLHLGANEIVHPDMQLVYKIAVEAKGLSTNSVKFINYDIQ